ncbi:unnamed protein product [Auanema sp. JU1783]|nr:unnamed protein product [Auanema sp. JU1783]
MTVEVFFSNYLNEQLGVGSDREPTWKEGTIAVKRVTFFIGNASLLRKSSSYAVLGCDMCRMQSGNYL